MFALALRRIADWLAAQIRTDAPPADAGADTPNARTREISVPVTNRQLLALYPQSSPVLRAEILHQAPELFARYGLDVHPNRLRHFLAQIGHESAGLARLEEGLSYSPKRLCQVWPSRFQSLAAAEPYAHNPQALANNVYADRMGNGPPASGDGWRYRGRGLLMITGRDAYRRVGSIANLPLERHPEMAVYPETALAVACAVWNWKGLAKYADLDDLRGLTRALNGGTHGLRDRQVWLDRVAKVLEETKP